MRQEPDLFSIPPKKPAKSAEAYRTISEVAEELDLPQHVLRFWESRFPQIKPMKRGGGRRYYRPDDVALIRRIRSLLYDEGYTIKGVQKLIRQQGGVKGVLAQDPEAAPETMPVPQTSGVLDGPSEIAVVADGQSEAILLDHEQRAALAATLGELEHIRRLLHQLA